MDCVMLPLFSKITLVYLFVLENINGTGGMASHGNLCLLDGEPVCDPTKQLLSEERQLESTGRATPHGQGFLHVGNSEIP